MSTLSRRDLFKGSLAISSLLAVPTQAHAGSPAQTLIDTTVNGQAHRLGLSDDDTALTIIRERLGLTGTKEACGHGACGACTVLVNGQPKVTCIQPASHLHRCEVTTIEGIASQIATNVSNVSLEQMHPVQRAFLAEDALQCGFCTPGFVVEGVGFVDRWRAEKGDVAPSDAEVMYAMSGHLCRCGAYPNIIRAIQGACAGKFDTFDTSYARVDGPEKVTGAAVYTVDVRLPSMVEAAFVRSPVASAGFIGVDTSAALATPGVVGITVLMQPGATLRYAGQPIAIVLAGTRELAKHVAREIPVRLRRGRVSPDLTSAKQDDAALVYTTKTRLPLSSEFPAFPAPLRANLRGPTRADIGTAPGQAQRATETPTVAGTWRTQAQCHTALEPHAVVARWESGRLTVWASTQMVHALGEELAQLQGLKPEQVEVIAEYVGGAFGAKAAWDLHIGHVVDAARGFAVPVRYVPDRHEELLLGGYRPPQEMEIAVSVGPRDTLEGIRLKSFGDSGVAIGANVGGIMRLRYPGAPKYLEDWDVLTHVAAARPFRGPGGPPGYFALEGAVDQIAADRGVSPIALRRTWDPAFTRLYDWAESLPVWKAMTQVRRDDGRYREGVGVATASWYHFVAPGIEVMLTADASGFTVRNASQDMGNGTRTSLAQAAADALGVDLHAIRVELGSSKLPKGPMSAGSRTTVSVRPAVFEAAARLQAEMLSAAVESFGLLSAAVTPGGVTHTKGFSSWSELLQTGQTFSAVGRRRVDPDGWAIPIVIKGAAIGKRQANAVQVSRVRVDTWLGRVDVLEVWAGFAVGRIHSPKLARSQAEGGILQAQGYALYEERRLDAGTGALLSHTLEDYHLPGIAETPTMHIHFDETPLEGLATEAVGLSEVTTCAGAASIANAVYRATGWRPTELPVRPDRVLKGLAQ